VQSVHVQGVKDTKGYLKSACKNFVARIWPHPSYQEDISTGSSALVESLLWEAICGVEVDIALLEALSDVQPMKVT